MASPKDSDSLSSLLFCQGHMIIPRLPGAAGCQAILGAERGVYLVLCFIFPLHNPLFPLEALT